MAHRARERAAAWPAEERESALLGVARALRAARGELVGLLVLDAGKRALEADIEVSEAIDFAEYYAHQHGRLREHFTLEPKGVVVVTPPWNFPLSIALGSALAALVAGNVVLLKPPPETPLVAARAVALCHAAGRSGLGARSRRRRGRSRAAVDCRSPRERGRADGRDGDRAALSPPASRARSDRRDGRQERAGRERHERSRASGGARRAGGFRPRRAEVQRAQPARARARGVSQRVLSREARRCDTDAAGRLGLGPGERRHAVDSTAERCARPRARDARRGRELARRADAQRREPAARRAERALGHSAEELRSPNRALRPRAVGDRGARLRRRARPPERHAVRLDRGPRKPRSERANGPSSSAPARATCT